MARKLQEILCSALLAVGGPVLAQECRVTAEVPLGQMAEAMVLTPDNRELYVGLDVPWVAVIEMRTHSIRRIPVDSKPTTLAVSSDGSSIYVGLDHGAVTVIETATKRISRLPVIGWVVDLAVDAANKYLYLAMCRAGLKRLDLKSGQVETLYGRYCPYSLAISPNQQNLWVNFQGLGPGGGPGHDSVGRFDLTTGRITKILTGMPNVGRTIRFSPDGKRLWANGSDACSAWAYDHLGCPFVPATTAQVIDVESGQIIRTIPEAVGVEFRALSPDGSLAAFIGDRLRLFDARQFRPLSGLNVHGADCVFSSDNTRLFVGDYVRRSIQIIEIRRTQR